MFEILTEFCSGICLVKLCDVDCLTDEPLLLICDILPCLELFEPYREFLPIMLEISLNARVTLFTPRESEEPTRDGYCGGRTALYII